MSSQRMIPSDQGFRMPSRVTKSRAVASMMSNGRPFMRNANSRKLACSAASLMQTQ